ncbi:PD40 domain-containing protein [Microbacteriaceae bacterium VKM Ac-2855]|nr:PD40 domain-containing protein [Microbacteriaceae bacterium VKM Ac-2855]
MVERAFHGLAVALTVTLALLGCSGAEDSNPTPGTQSGAVPTRQPSSEATVLPDEPWLSYQSSNGGQSSIHLIRPDGSDDHVLLGDPPGRTTHPDWSPDGQRLVFTVDDSELWTVEADGTDLERLPVDCGADCYLLDGPAWSPDGTTVAYTHIVLPDQGLPTTTIETVDIATGEVTVIYTQPDPLQLTLEVRWAPTGDAVVFDLFRYENADSSTPNGTAIAVLDLGAGTATRITDWTMFATYPDWSPDGESIVFSTFDLGDRDAGNSSNPLAASDLYTVSPDGSALVQLTHNPTGTELIRNDTAGGPLSSQPTWTPRGDGITFVQVDGATWPGWTLASLDPANPEVTPAAGNEYIEGTHPRLRPTA